MEETQGGQGIEIVHPGVQKRQELEGHDADPQQGPPTVDVGQRAGRELEEHPGKRGDRHDEPDALRTGPQGFCEQRQHRHPDHVVADKAEHADGAEQRKAARRRHGAVVLDWVALLECDRFSSACFKKATSSSGKAGGSMASNRTRSGCCRMRWLNRLTVSTPLPSFRVTVPPISGRSKETNPERMRLSNFVYETMVLSIVSIPLASFTEFILRNTTAFP